MCPEVILCQGQPTQNRDIRWRGQPIINRNIRRGDQPTQPHARDGARGGGESGSTDDVNAKIVWVGQGGSARDVLVNGREGQAGEEVGVSVFLSSSIGEAEVIGRKKFHPALNVQFGFSDFANLLEALMVGGNEEVHTEHITSEASNTPHDASGFEFHRGPVLLIVESGSADIDDGVYGAIRLFLFEGGSEASGTGVAVEAEGSRRVNDCVPVREDKYWGCCEFR